jgi:outer membrane protein insertion porin family
VFLLLAAPVLPAPTLFAQQTGATAAPAPAGQQNVVAIRVIGSRRIPQDTVRARMFSKIGEPYDPLTVERDFNSLWNTGYFEDVRIEKEDTAQGVILNVYVREKPTIREIKYNGLNAFTVSDAMDRFKKEKVGLTEESQYDPARIAHAVTVLKEMEAEHGHQFATVRTEVKDIPPASVQLIFNVKEGPTVKVGKITFSGNRHVSSRVLRESMKNLRPIGIPHSIFLENIFSKTYDASKLNEDAERVRMAYQQKGYFKAIVEDPKTKLRDTHSLIHIPLIQKGQGKVVDITMPIVEGDRYRLGSITFQHNKAVRNQKALRSLFPMKDGDIFNTDNVRKGLENLPTANLGISISPRSPIPRSTKTRKSSTWSLMWTKASLSTSAALNSRAIPPPATKSFAANWPLRKGRCTTRAFGSSACFASTSSTISRPSSRRRPQNANSMKRRGP